MLQVSRERRMCPRASSPRVPLKETGQGKPRPWGPFSSLSSLAAGRELMEFLVHQMPFEHLLFYKCGLSNSRAFEAKEVTVAIVTTQIL